MDLLTWYYLIGVLVFGFLSLYLSIEEYRTKKLLLKKEYLQRQRTYEISLLKILQDRIGYSLDVDRVLDTITGSLKDLIPYSVASSVVIEENKLLFKVYVEEVVSRVYIEDLKKNMLTAVKAISHRTLPLDIEEQRIGPLPDESKLTTALSSFTLPVLINGEIVGLIAVSSTKSNIYLKDDVTVLYEMVNQASMALSRLREVINTEEGKLLAMIGSLADGIVTIGTNNQLILINDSAKHLLAPDTLYPTILDISRMLPKTIDFTAFVKESMTKRIVLHKKDVLIGDKTIEITITPIIGPRAEILDVKSEKSVIGVAVLFHDVTLEKHLAELKEMFTHSVVHEMRSPLTAIKASAEMLEKEQALSQQGKHFASIITTQAKRMLEDIGSLLDAAKLESGHLSILQTPNDMRDVITNTVEVFLPQAKEKHVTVITHVDDRLPKANIDSVRISQVITNLLSNSLKFTMSGGHIAVKAEFWSDDTKPKGITNPGIAVSVTDTGLGIPLDKQPLLFSEFSQVTTSETQVLNTPQKGTGLGLFITKGIVEAHGGSIWLKSIPHQGTTITFTVPIAG